MLEDNIMEEKGCPICGEAIRSEANEHIFCKLCGMGVQNPEFAPRYQTMGGEVFYFCCDRCLKIYKNDIELKKEM
jgi:YHS domain-containing protein